MLCHWGMIEADFLREYRINLEQEINTITWRKFIILLKNLSVNSNWYLINMNANNKENELDIITDNKLAERMVDRVWG